MNDANDFAHSQLEEVADIARVTRTCRLFYYLTLPRLYEAVYLRAHSSIRYINDRPEGFGGGSPFSMALDGLISSPNNVAQYVKDLRLSGEWKETDTEDFSRGRVPDNTMMLNVVVKAAILRSESLQHFRFVLHQTNIEALTEVCSWDLNTKPMKTIYQGLQTRTNLTSLKLYFPSSRIPRPTVVIPPIPRLKELSVENMDPLCYNDDISLLLQTAHNLEDLKMHWSPRMRKTREPSTFLNSYFGRITPETQLKLKRWGFANLFARNDQDIDRAISFDQMEAITFINCMDHDDPMTVFLDSTWKPRDLDDPGAKRIRKIRGDKVDEHLVAVITALTDLQEIYLVNNRKWWTNDTSTPVDSPSNLNISGKGHSSSSSTSGPPLVTMSDIGHTADTNGLNGHETPRDAVMGNSNAFSPDNHPSPSTPTTSKTKDISLASDCIAAMTCRQGPNLRIVVLKDTWVLGTDVIKHFLSACPNLEQLALSPEEPAVSSIRNIAGTAKNLWALRLLFPPNVELWRTMSAEPKGHCDMLSFETVKPQYQKLRWIGIGGFYTKLEGLRVPIKGMPPRRVVRMVGWEEARKVEVFGMDSDEL